MIGTYQNGFITYTSPYAQFNNSIANAYYASIYTLYGPEHEQRQPIYKYEIYNPQNLELIEDAEYDFEIIYFDDGNIAEITSKI